MLGGTNRVLGTMHYEDIDFQTNQVCCQLGELFVPALDMALFDDEVLSLHVPEIAQAVLEGSPPGLVEVGRIRRQKAYPQDLRHVLRLTGEWRKSKAQSQNDRESNQPHGHLVWDGWRGV